MKFSLLVRRGEIFINILQLKQFNYKTEQIVAFPSYKNDRRCHNSFCFFCLLLVLCDKIITRFRGHLFVESTGSWKAYLLRRPVIILFLIPIRSHDLTLFNHQPPKGGEFFEYGGLDFFFKEDGQI